MRKFPGVYLLISQIFIKFYNIMKYIINIILIGVSDPRKISLHQSGSPLRAEHRCVCGLVK